jgi:antibiotic biosynthesis monooxygenase (ABM) superfamily enzyme
MTDTTHRQDADPNTHPNTEDRRDTDTEGRTATAVFTWDVKAGRGSDFERWAHGINSAAARHPGHLGATWLRAEGIRHRYYTVVNFSDEDRLAAWLESPERAEWIERVDGIAEEHRHHTTGLETWFSLPGESVPPPAHWKMVIATFSAVYPLSLLFQGVVAPLTQDWPLLLRALAFPLVMVPLLTYAVMPALSRALRRWLYPARRSHPPARPDP